MDLMLFQLVNQEHLLSTYWILNLSCPEAILSTVLQLIYKLENSKVILNCDSTLEKLTVICDFKLSMK